MGKMKIVESGEEPVGVGDPLAESRAKIYRAALLQITLPQNETEMPTSPEERHRLAINLFLQANKMSREVNTAFQTLAKEINQQDNQSAIQTAKNGLDTALVKHFFPKGLPTHRDDQWKVTLVSSIMPTIVSELSQAQREYTPERIEEIVGAVQKEAEEDRKHFDPSTEPHKSWIPEILAIRWLERAAGRGSENIR